MTYKLKITKDKKTKEQNIKDLKELQTVLQQYKDNVVEIELHKVKVYKNENK